MLINKDAYIETSYNRILWNQFRKNRRALWASRSLVLLLLIALFADVIANEKPLYCKINDQHYFPIFRQYGVDLGWQPTEKAFLNQDWKTIAYQKAIFPPIPYSPHTLDMGRRYQSPFEAGNAHYFGTSELGKDVAASMVHGTRTAMLVGIFSMCVATGIGLLLGGLAGYFGDKSLKISWIRLVLYLVAMPFWVYYLFILPNHIWSSGQNLSYFLCVAWSLGILGLVHGFAWIGERRPFFTKKVFVPLDIIIMRIIEIFNAIPTLLFLLAVIAIVQKPSIWILTGLIGGLAWTGIARFIRAELLRIRSLEYITAAHSMGFSDFRILWRHALPNGLTPVMIRVAFGIAAAILFESTLSFLGIGVAFDDMTWGKLLANARHKPQAWWLTMLPGFAIFISVLIFNFIGEGLSNSLNPKNNSKS